MNVYWEPWTPIPDQRVKIRLSGECEHETGRPFESLDGLLGTVVHVLESGEPAIYRRPDGSDLQLLDVKGHRFAVVPDHPKNLMGWFAWLAAIELEPA